MAISAEDVKKLREETGAGMLDCKKALDDASGDFAKAKELLTAKGLDTAMKRGERETAEGLVHSYIHHNGRVGALVEVNCESDFVARTDDFKDLVAAIALQVAGANPKYLSKEDMPAGAEEDAEDRRAPRAALPPRRVDDRRPDGHPGHSQNRRKHPHQALRAV